MEAALTRLAEDDGRLEAKPVVGLTENNALLHENLRRCELATDEATPPKDRAA